MKRRYPDFWVASVSHNFCGMVKVPEYKYEADDGEIEPRDFIAYEIEYYGTMPFQITLQIPTYETFYGFICKLNYDTEDHAWHVLTNNDELYDKTLTIEYCKDLANRIASELKPEIKYVKEFESHFWYDGYEYAGYDGKMREEEKET